MRFSHYEYLPHYIYRNIIFGDRCFEWGGAISNWGYGTTTYRGKTIMAHRIIWILLKGKIPKGLEMDHLCRNRKCVNINHLEPVTRKENVARGISPAAINRVKTHCPHGHEYNAENTQLIKRGWRQCKVCKKLRYKKSRQSVAAPLK